MKKGVAFAFVCISIFLLVSAPIVSAGWFGDLINNVKDFFGNTVHVTGNVPGVGGCTESDSGDYPDVPGNCADFTEGSPYSDGCTNLYTNSLGFSYYKSIEERFCSGIGNDASCLLTSYDCDTYIDGVDDESSICSGGACVQNLNCTGNIFTSFCSLLNQISCSTESLCEWVGPSIEGECIPKIGVSCTNNFANDLAGCIEHNCEWRGYIPIEGCGNNIIEGNEICDGNSLGGESCVTQGYDFGNLGCNNSCNGFDFSGCDYFCTEGDIDACVLLDGSTGQRVCEIGGVWSDCQILVCSDQNAENYGAGELCTYSSTSNPDCIDKNDNSYDCSVVNQQSFTYFEDYDINNDGVLETLDQVSWVGLENRIDVSTKIISMIIPNQDFPEHYSDPILGCTDDLAINYNPSANIDDGSCDYVEFCDGQDNNGDGQIDEGCIFYSIESLLFSSGESWENADISLSCKFNVSSLTEDVSNINFPENCIFASVDGNSNSCEFVYGGEGDNGVYYQSFNCDVGDIGKNKEILCGVNEGGGCGIGVNQFSLPGLINVTTPLVCPALGNGDISVDSSIDLNDLNLDVGDNLTFDWEYTNYNPSNEVEVVTVAGLYELNEKKILDEDIQEILLNSSSNFVEISLDVPLIVNEGNYRIYIKTIDADESEFCMLDKYNVDIDTGNFNPSNINVDLRYDGGSSININNLQIITFTLNGVNYHTLEVKSISGTTATFEIMSDPINVTLSEGEEKEVDLDGDGILDISISLIQISGNSISLSLDALEIFTGCVDGQIQDCGIGNEGTQFCNNGVWGSCSYNEVGGSNESNNSNSQNSYSENSFKFPWLIILGIFIGLLIIFILVIIMKRKFDKKVSGGRQNPSNIGQGPGNFPSFPKVRPRAPVRKAIIRRPIIRRPLRNDF